MQRFTVATWILGAALAAGLLPGCADVIAEQGGVSMDPRGASSPVRVDTRADRRAYYAYSRSVWAEIQGDLEAAVQWSREALRFDPTSRVVRNHLASVLLKKGDFERVPLDLNEIVGRVDLDAVVRRVDLDAAVERVDLQRVVDRIDVDAIAAGVDLDAVVGRLDLAGIATRVIEEIDLPGIIRSSSETMAAETAEGIRVQGMEADRLVAGVVDRVLRRRRDRDTQVADGLAPPETEEDRT